MSISTINNNLLNKIVNYDNNKNKLLLNNKNKLDYIEEQLKSNKCIKNYIIKACLVIQQAIYHVPENWLSFLTRKVRVISLANQINKDNKLLPADKATRVAGKVDKLISSKGLFDKTSAKDKEYARKIGLAAYATTQKYYAPMVYEWTLSLLERAKKENTHLVFLARDGLPAYEMAKIIREHHTEYQDVPMNYMYISRNVVKNHEKNQELPLSDYIKQELLSPEKPATASKYLFVDIGFLGSMIEPITDQAIKAGISKEKISFEYFISHTPKAQGFLDPVSQSIDSVKSAGKNRSTYWLEDTHQGAISSSACLIKENDKIVPYVLSNECKDKTCRSRNELDYLCKEMAQKALKDFADDQKKSPFIAIDHKNFNNWLWKIKKERMLYVEHV
jgi:hypothetical protein